MVFSSAIFLFAFLPVTYAVYCLVPGIKAKNIVLVVFSLLFYSFGSLTYLPLLLLSILFNWLAGRILGSMEKDRKKVRRTVVAIAVVFNIGLLVVFKYLGFFIGNINSLFRLAVPVPRLTLPLAISFFTFTGMSYVIEVYRKPANMSKSLVKVILYISLFPNQLSGPILNYKTAAPQIDERTCTTEKTARGLRRFIIGLAKKLLVADIIGGMVDSVFSGSVLDARIAWLAVIGYAIQIYFDFSGYSDMALGLAGLFGFEFPENFNHPYTALDLSDYWKRWHISLTTWFRNYLYMPMVMSRPLQKLYKKWAAKYGRAKANRISILIPSIVVWLLTGLWHGPSWSYVLWGLWNGMFCILEGVGLIRTAKLKESAGGRAVLHVYTLAVVLFGALLFRAAGTGLALPIMKAMVSGWRFTAEGTLFLQRNMTGLRIFSFLAGIIGSTAIVPWLKKHTGRVGEPLSYAASLVLLVLCIMNMAVTGFQPFIYLQF